jgi:hypothetical protein
MNCLRLNFNLSLQSGSNVEYDLGDFLEIARFAATQPEKTLTYR